MPIIEIKSVKKAAELLKQGEIVVYPTETAYALGGDATNLSIIGKIFSLKARSGAKPLAVICDSLTMVKNYFKLNQLSRSFAEKYWPGPVTLILPVKNKKLLNLNKHGNKVGVRVTDGKIAQKLCNLLGTPIISTSANISGQSTSYSAAAVYKQFSKVTDKIYFLNQGTLPRRATSAVVDVNDDKIKIIRFNSVLKK